MFGVLALVLVYVSISHAVNHNTNCYIQGKTKDYNGNFSHSRSGKKCLDWGACPEYRYYNGSGYYKLQDTDLPDGSVIAASNYCRDPASFGYVWCFINYLSYRCVARNICDVNECNTECYFKGQSKEYRGYIKETQGGIKCLNWKDKRGYEHTKDVNFPDGSVDEASYYCRDPNKNGRPWCFGADGHWDNCTVPVCSIGAN